ncbi:MAG: hydrogenase expression/formation protein HypE [candidate division WOR-3 bacterium]|nr:hydrogenase expression/formation protein HypE [candidate division WOR-3 bacterium]
MNTKQSLKNIKTISIEHGAGGRKMHRLIRELFLKYFDNPILKKFEDSAEIVLKSCDNKFCYTIDSYVVQPLFFPGGDIGKLAICGTVNDLAVKGARPLYIALSFVITEGLSLNSLEKICISISKITKSLKIFVVTGDTKVIEHRYSKTNWSLDDNTKEEIIITTCGIGEILPVFSNPTLSVRNIEIGDQIIINGNIGEHEAAILLARKDYHFKGKVKSDCAAIYPLIETLARNQCKIKMMRDPTRGGIATTLNEIADDANISIIIDENKLPISDAVRGLAELLGIDPLYMANEGKVIIIADKKETPKIVKLMKNHPQGKNTRVIGEVTERYHGLGVWLKTQIGGLRPVLQLEGSQLPRIC